MWHHLRAEGYRNSLKPLVRNCGFAQVDKHLNRVWFPLETCTLCIPLHGLVGVLCPPVIVHLVETITVIACLAANTCPPDGITIWLKELAKWVTWS